MDLKYDRGEHRRKHCWSEGVAGSITRGRNRVGQCSNLLSDALAAQLLNDGVRVDEEMNELTDSRAFPRAVSNVFQGVPYRAVKTDEAARSLHGYPCLREDELPTGLRETLRARAASEGHQRAFDSWIREQVKPR
mgnify:CR=1 FL=1